MSFEIAISPSGNLSAEILPEAKPMVEPKWVRRVEEAFGASAGEGLMFLAGEAMELALPASPAYWRDFGRRFLHRLCQTSTEGDRVVVPAVMDADELSSFGREAPPMRGGEFLDTEMLRRLWVGMGEYVERAAGDGLGEWLKSKGSHWHTVGRVTFHLAENKRDPERPFAFLATYTHELAASGKPQHLPLAKRCRNTRGRSTKRCWPICSCQCSGRWKRARWRGSCSSLDGFFNPWRGSRGTRTASCMTFRYSRSAA